MKIDSAGPTRSTAALRRGERAGGGKPGEFARHLDSASSGAGVTGAQPVNAIDALLALQQVEDDGDSTERQPDELAMPDRRDEGRDLGLAGGIERGQPVDGERRDDAEQRPIELAEAG